MKKLHPLQDDPTRRLANWLLWAWSGFHCILSVEAVQIYSEDDSSKSENPSIQWSILIVDCAEDEVGMSAQPYCMSFRHIVDMHRINVQDESNRPCSFFIQDR
jgi:hypothetical protein